MTTKLADISRRRKAADAAVQRVARVAFKAKNRQRPDQKLQLPGSH